MEYARGFSITKCDGYTTLEVRNPWDTLLLLHSYLLLERGDSVPVGFEDHTVVRVPVERMAISSSVDAGALEMLDALGCAVAVCEPEYMGSEMIKSGVASGAIKDLGKATRPSLEVLLSSGAEMIVVSPFKNQGFGAIEKSGVPIVECASYTESSPLARAEWIKFYGAFLCKESVADSLFAVERDRYSGLKSKAEGVEYRPMVLAGMRYGQVWNISSGDSYAANLYYDAGARYPWSELKGEVYVPMSPESVAVAAEECDLWLISYYNPSGDYTMESLVGEFELYGQLRPYRQNRVYGVNTAVKRLYEETPFAPSLYLEDLIKSIHPGILDGECRYFSKLK